MSWCVETAGQVLSAMWEQDVAQLCGERWHPKTGARVARAGACSSDITLAGRRVRVRRPRVRSRDGREIELPTYRFVSRRDPLDAVGLDQVASAVSTGAAPETAPREAQPRRFLADLTRRLQTALAQPSWEYCPCLLLGELTFREHYQLIALGLTPDGGRRLLALRAGSAENPGAARALLEDLSDRSAPLHAPELVIVGERPGLDAAVRRHFEAPTVYRCPVEKRRRVIGLLPPEDQPGALRALRAAYQLESEARARRALEGLARSWAGAHSRAAQALRDGLGDTLTLHRLRGASGVRPRRPRPEAKRPQRGPARPRKRARDSGPPTP
ncbi:MAG: transposase [Myxococcota bacterium]